jgi:hypothetical protein
MSIRTAVLLLSLVLALILIVFLPWSSLLTLFSGTGFSEDDIRAYVRKYIELHYESMSKDVAIKEIKIKKVDLHGQELSVAKVDLRLRGDFETTGTLYLVDSPDHSAYLTGSKYLLNAVDRYGYDQVSQRIPIDTQPKETPTPTSTVIHHEYPAPTKTP